MEPIDVRITVKLVRRLGRLFVIVQAAMIVTMAIAMLAGPLLLAAAGEASRRAEITLAQLG